jgi:hypothetical protein
MTAMVLSIIMAEAQETFIMKKIAGYAHCNCFRVAIKNPGFEVVNASS